LSPGRLRQILKKKGLKWKRVRLSHHGKQDPQKRAIKQADLEMLELAAACGEIDLYYLDESGLCLWSKGGYSYYFQGEQKCLEQTQSRGRRLSILGLWQPGVEFTYGLAIGSFNDQRYMAMMEEQAKQASHILSKTGRIRVIVQDNGSSHRSAKVQQQWSEWENQGLYIFFLPEYCSEMNPIELEWQHLKKDEIAGQMFEDELDLAYAVIAGVEARGQRNGHNTHRFKFPSTYASQSVT
jgi:hypothetical protein